MKRNGFYKKCAVCGKERYVVPSMLRTGRGKYCSMSCRSKVSIHKALATRDEKKWKASISKAMKKRFRDETKHPRWKGGDVGYFGVHDWVTKHYGQPKYCDVCGLNDKKRVYHWANLTNKYKRDISDWKRMCVSCHRKYDYKRKAK